MSVSKKMSLEDLDGKLFVSEDAEITTRFKMNKDRQTMLVLVECDGDDDKYADILPFAIEIVGNEQMRDSM